MVFVGSKIVSKIASKINEWHSWEDENALKVLRDIYRGFHRFGFVVLDLSSSFAGLSIFAFIFGGLVLLTLSGGLVYSCYLMRDDFAVASGNCNLGFLSSLSLSFLINHSYYRRKILKLHRMIGAGFYDYNEPQYYPGDVKDWIHQIGKLKKTLILLASYVVLIAILVVFVCPIIDDSLGFGWDVPYDEFGVNRQLPVPLWLPFESHEGIKHWFSFLVLEGFGGAMITLCIGGTSLLFTGLCGGLLLEQKLLVLSLRGLEKRALRMYKQRKGAPTKSLNGKKKSLADDPFYQECIGNCLKENVKHHHAILEYTRLYLIIARCPFLAAFFVETAAIAMSMVKLNEASSKWGANIAFACIAIAEVANMVMLCVLGELVTSLSTEINEELYRAKWHKFNKQNRMTLLQFLIGTKNPIRLTALGLVVCNMEQFSQVMNTAYSFFNLLKVTKAMEG